jgi:hypothetical protein
LIVGRGVTNISYVLDCEGLSQAVLGSKKLTPKLKFAHRRGVPVVTSSMTLIEAYHGRIRQAPWNWTLSRIVVRPVTEPIAEEAIALLKAAGLHGHKYAIDAALAAIVRRLPGTAVVFTSDKDDMSKLCGDRAIIEPL